MIHDMIIKKSWLERLRAISRATKQHATNLAKFVAIYKTLLLVQRKLNGGKARPHDTFFAGLLGGYFVFGERNAINEQVCTVFVRPSDLKSPTHTPIPTPVPFPPSFPLAAVLLCVHPRVSFSSFLDQISNASPIMIAPLDCLVRLLPCGRFVYTPGGFAT